MEQNKKTSTLEKIKELNPGGISDNRLIAQLNRILNETKGKSIQLGESPSNSPKQQASSRSEEQVREELTNLLSKTPNTEQYREQLKQQYLSNYLTKFGVEPNNSQPKQQTVLEQLEQFKQRTKQLNQSLNNSQTQTLEQKQQKKSDVTTTINNILNKGKDIGNRIRDYAQRYKTQLSLQDNKQLTNTDKSRNIHSYPSPELVESVQAKEATDSREQQQLHQDQQQWRIQSRELKKDNKGPEIGD